MSVNPSQANYNYYTEIFYVIFYSITMYKHPSHFLGCYTEFFCITFIFLESPRDEKYKDKETKSSAIAAYFPLNLKRAIAHQFLKTECSAIAS